MSRYTYVKVNISKALTKTFQNIDKSKRAVQTGSTVSIGLSHSDLNSEHVLAPTTAQVNKIAKVYQSGTGVTIKMSKTQPYHNAKVDSGFIGDYYLQCISTTAGKVLLSKVLPALATGVLSGVGQAAGSTVVNKIAGNGFCGTTMLPMYMKKNGMGCKVRAAGQGLYLSPWSEGSSLCEGMFL